MSDIICHLCFYRKASPENNKSKHNAPHERHLKYASKHLNNLSAEKLSQEKRKRSFKIWLKKKKNESLETNSLWPRTWKDPDASIYEAGQEPSQHSSLRLRWAVSFACFLDVICLVWTKLSKVGDWMSKHSHHFPTWLIWKVVYINKYSFFWIVPSYQKTEKWEFCCHKQIQLKFKH